MIRTLIFAALTSLTLAGCSKSQENRPNIVLLFVDDMGWDDVGYRNPVFKTPNIDQLKNEGLDFTRMYIPTPTCSPSRTSLLTGKESVRVQMVRHIHGGPDEEFSLWEKDPAQMPSRNWLPLEEITYAERLGEYGYYNLFLGKWHQGHEPYYPVHQGFDRQYGTGDHGHPGSYYPPFFKKGNPLPEFTGEEYLTDVLTDEAVKFIGGYEGEQPFMISLWYYNVHGPHIGRKDLLDLYKDSGWPKRQQEYGAMVSAVDESVGRIRKALEDEGIADNTILMFLSDQGGYFDNPPFRGGKRGGFTLCEGGARVPFIVHYPGVTGPGTTCNTPVQSIDVYPTLVELASGTECTDNWINGKSLLPLLSGGSLQERNLYFFRSYEDQYAAVLSDNWKLIKYRSGYFELYNLETDIAEATNLYEIETQKAEKLKKDLEAWEKEAVPEY